MSPALRDELLNLLFERDPQQGLEIPTESDDHENLYLSYAVEPPILDYVSPIEESPTGKLVIEINTAQLEALIANLNDKSVETLKYFATGGPVALDELVGENRPYANFTELKRSFVGPVNRRLRTVTKNRAAVLFRKVSEDDDNPLIDVKPGTSEAIRQVLINAEPK